MESEYKVTSSANHHLSLDEDSFDSGFGSELNFDEDFSFSDLLQAGSPKASSSPVSRVTSTHSTRSTLHVTPQAEEGPVPLNLSEAGNITQESSNDASYIARLNGLKLSFSDSLSYKDNEDSFLLHRKPASLKHKQASQKLQPKRRKFTTDVKAPISSPVVADTFQSEREDHAKAVLNRCAQEDNLTGDFAQSCSLPCITGKHQDLKYVTPTTVSQVLDGEYDLEYKIIDCRYPYEYQGGHIKYGQNLYTKDEITSEFLMEPKQTSNPEKRLVLIFHCEFSSERGPQLARFLRNQDHELNKDSYPHLHYPEVYVLEDGYKNFYEQCIDKCQPQTYKPMLHKEHSDDLKHYRAKAKSCEKKKSRRAFSRRLDL